MYDSPESLETELSLPPRWVIVSLAIFGCMLSGVSEFLEYSVKIEALGVFTTLLSAMAWLIADRYSRLGRWATLAVVMVIAHLANNWLGVAGSLALMPLPVVLAGVLLGPLGAILAAAVQTALVVLLPGAAAIGGRGISTGLAVLAVWGVLGVLALVYQPMHQRDVWLAEYYRRARQSLEEIRDRRARLGQALEDLAHANEQLVLANQRMAALRLMAERARKGKADFVARVSHEFRGPLNIITGMVDLMVEEPDIIGVDIPSRLLEHLQIVYRNSKHLSSLIDDVLDLSQVEAGRMPLRRQWTDLAEIVQSAAVAVRPLVEKKGLDLDVTVPDDLPQVKCDGTRIRQVLLNLLGNAARLTERGQIAVEVTPRDGRVLISVADTGPGIAEEDAEIIFEPFYRGSSTSWRDGAGSGLGLSISKELVELHHGRMWLESELGTGTTFFIELPISEPAEPTSRPDQWIREEWIWREHAFKTSRAALAGQVVKPHMVVCDETGELYPLLARYCHDVELLEATDLGQISMELQRCPAQAVMVAASSLPDIWHLVERVSREAPDTPILGCWLPQQIERALKSGAVDYLTKPVTRRRLSEVIEAIGEPIRRVLIVDDEADILELLALLVKACVASAEIETAQNGQEALEKMRSTPFDLVLLDLVMPDLDGWEVLSIKSQDEALRKIPTVVISGRDQGTRPVTSRALVATMGAGLSLSKLLQCSRQISNVLLNPD